MWGASEWIHNYTSNDTVIFLNGVMAIFSVPYQITGCFDGRMGYIETLPSRSYGMPIPLETNLQAHTESIGWLKRFQLVMRHYPQVYLECLQAVEIWLIYP